MMLARVDRTWSWAWRGFLRAHAVLIGAKAYAIFNGYGTIVVHLEFTSNQFRHQIEAKLSVAGWHIEDSSGWETARRLDLVRAGPGLLGSYTRAKTIESLMTVLAAIPNKVVVLKPEFFRPDFAKLPGWAIDGAQTNADLKDIRSRTPIIYGNDEASRDKWRQLVPDAETIPDDAAAKLERWPPRQLSPWQLLWGGLAVSGIPLSLLLYQPLKSWWGNSPVIGDLFIPAPNSVPVGWYVLMVGWPVAWWAIFMLRLGAAQVFGTFKGSDFNWGAVFKTDSRTPRAMKRAKQFPRWVSEKEIPDKGIRVYTRARFACWLLALFGLGWINGTFLYSLFLYLAAREVGLVFMAAMSVVTVLVWFAGEVRRARLLLQARSFPRLALSVGSYAVAGAVLIRLPAWAYLEGVGVPELSGGVDWIGVLSLSLGFVAVCILCAGFGWVLWWVSRHSPPVASIAGSMGVVAILILLPLMVLSQVNAAGYGLRTEGTGNYTQGNYPAAACLRPAEGTVKSRAVWVLGVIDNRTLVAARSETEKPLSQPGHVTAFPTDSVVLDMVSDVLKDGVAQAKPLCSSVGPN